MVSIKFHSGIYTLEVDQIVKVSLDEAWAFFSSPANLSRITPSHMGFKITSVISEEMYPGQIITYKVSPFAGYTTNWVTEITQVEHQSFFIDEQRFGPYRMWHHEHHFKLHPEGVIMIDRVSYKLPFVVFGRLAHGLFVGKQLRKIFEFREKCLQSLFA